MTNAHDTIKRRTHSPAEAARILGVAETTVRDAISRGELPAERVGRRIVIFGRHDRPHDI